MLTAIKNARLFDGSGREPYGPVHVIIEDDRILTVGPAQEVAVPENAQVIDAEGKWLMPGMIVVSLSFCKNGS